MSWRPSFIQFDIIPPGGLPTLISFFIFSHRGIRLKIKCRISSFLKYVIKYDTPVLAADCISRAYVSVSVKRENKQIKSV